jgi:hypothetical protein
MYIQAKEKEKDKFADVAKEQKKRNYRDSGKEKAGPGRAGDGAKRRKT